MGGGEFHKHSLVLAARKFNLTRVHYIALRPNLSITQDDFIRQRRALALNGLISLLF
jgi:hypothetical protein